jgi:transcription elongation factor Elf1
MGAEEVTIDFVKQYIIKRKYKCQFCGAGGKENWAVAETDMHLTPQNVYFIQCKNCGHGILHSKSFAEIDVKRWNRFWYYPIK